MTGEPLRTIVFGATGRLGRPVIRRLVADDRFQPVAFVRDERMARRVLPDSAELAVGNLRDRDSVARALEGVDAAHLNLSHPFNPRAPFDPDRDGTKLIAELAPVAGLRRLVRLSALDAGGAHSWWPLQRKTQADEAALASGVPCTIFRPTWFMESLAMFVIGPLMTVPHAAPVRLRWLAGEDYAAQVAEALAQCGDQSGTLVAQGPEALTLRDAARRFAAAYRRLRTLTIPRPALRAGAVVSAKARYLRELLDATVVRDEPFQAEAAWERFGAPTMSVEDYARSIAETGDLPRP